MKRLALTTALLALLAPTALAQGTLPGPKTVDLGSGLHVIIGQGGNIGVSAGADGIFVIDDQYPGTAPANLEKIKAIAGGAPNYLVNTHWHADHAGGNAAFGTAGAMIFAHESVRKRLTAEVASIGIDGKAAAAAPEVAWPVVTFAEGIDFHLNDETIRVVHVKSSHTDGDAMVWFIEPNVLHMGDLFFNGVYPVIDLRSGGSVRGYLDVMKDTLAKVNDTTKIIPGHGDVGTKADLAKQIAMLDGAIKAVEAEVKKGRTLQQVIAARPLKPWANYAWSFISEESFTTTLYNGLKQ
jgi:glyoxylase-like metal-dependent hydrolase (beta-lactamase superfamily II)